MPADIAATPCSREILRILEGTERLTAERSQPRRTVAPVNTVLLLVRGQLREVPVVELTREQVVDGPAGATAFFNRPRLPREASFLPSQQPFVPTPGAILKSMLCLKHREKYARIAVSGTEVVVCLPRLDARGKRPCERLAICTSSSGFD